MNILLDIVQPRVDNKNPLNDISFPQENLMTVYLDPDYATASTVQAIFKYSKRIQDRKDREKNNKKKESYCLSINSTHFIGRLRNFYRSSVRKTLL